MRTQKELLEELKAPWPERYTLPTETPEQRRQIIAIQELKKAAAKEIERLNKLLE